MAAFDIDRFVEDCRQAIAQDPTHKAAREVVARAVSDPGAVLAGIGEPTRAGVQRIYRSSTLTILNLVWGPMMTLMPHNHRMWAVIGIYTGREDNIFWRRIDGDTHATALAAPPAVATARGETTPRWVHETLAAWEIPAASGTGDWTHVARVVAEFRCRCCRDDAAVTPAECSDTLEHFMTVSRRGRAYDFAGAAALMLRGCGYQTRLAGGLFVSGERRDARSRRLISTEDDAHVWAEILDAAGRWIPIEATPGFTIRQSTIPWWTPLVSAGAWVRGHATMIAAAWIALTALGIVAHAGWRPCVDAATTLWWRHAVRWPDACPLSVTWSLLAWRGWLAGCPRGRHETIREWYRRTSRAKPTGRWAHAFLAAYENAAYGPVRVSDDLGRQRRLAEAVAARITVQSLCRPPGMGMRSTREKRRWRWS